MAGSWLACCGLEAESWKLGEGCSCSRTRTRHLIVCRGRPPPPPPPPPPAGPLGSPGFVAPEVVAGGVHTPAMDVFSLGVLLFIMLVGVRWVVWASVLGAWPGESGSARLPAVCPSQSAPLRPAPPPPAHPCRWAASPSTSATARACATRSWPWPTPLASRTRGACGRAGGGGGGGGCGSGGSGRAVGLQRAAIGCSRLQSHALLRRVAACLSTCPSTRPWSHQPHPAPAFCPLRCPAPRAGGWTCPLMPSTW